VESNCIKIVRVPFTWQRIKRIMPELNMLMYVRFHKIRELLTNTGHILLEKIHSSENAADLLTKLVTSDKFMHFLNLLHMFLSVKKEATP
jgi:hypothetical protein